MTRALALALAAGLLAGCGGGGSGDDGGAAAVKWRTQPQAFRPRDLPRDRIVLGSVRNVSGKALRLSSSKIVVRDADGHVLHSSARYIAGYAHGLYGAFQKPDPLPPDELRRMGIAITLKPGATAPVYVAWRLRQDSRGPATVDLGPGRLTLPTRATTAR